MSATTSPPPGTRSGPFREGELPAHPHASRLIGILVGTYIALVVGLALSGRFTFVVKTAVVPALVLAAAVTGRLRAFVRDWAPFLGVVILFDCIRGLIFGVVSHYHLPYYASYAIDWEKALFAGWTLPTLLQAAFFSGHIGAFEKGLVLVHASHFVAFLLFGLTVWLLRPLEFRRYARAISLLLAVGLCLYFAVPTVPPWMAAQLHLIPPIVHISDEVYNVISPTLGRTFGINPIAAMPSLHTALPVLCCAIAWRHFRLRSLPMLAYTGAVIFAIGYLGEHYYVDILAGAALAVAVYLIAYRTTLLDRAAGRGGDVHRESRWVLVRPVAFGLSLVVIGEIAGQVTLAIRQPVQPDEAFVRREMVGRSDLAPLLLSRFAADRGDHVAARRLAERAAAELRDPKDRQVATEFLSRLPAVQ